jgi:SAM-dependent methyltransferase
MRDENDMKRIFQDTWFDEWFVRKEELLHERFIDYAWVLSNIEPIRVGWGEKGVQYFHNILDAGCGGSFMPLLLATLGHEVTAIDAHPMDYQLPQYTFVQGNLTSFHLDQKFDYIYSLSTLEHVGVMNEKDPNKDFLAVVNLGSHLAHGGRMIITVPFGVPTTLNGWRVYDQKRLDLLFPYIEKQDYFIRDGFFWRKAPWAEACNAVHVQGEPHRAITCLLGSYISGQ